VTVAPVSGLPFTGLSATDLPAACLAAATDIGYRLARDAMWDGIRCNWFGPAFDDFGAGQQLGFGTLGPTLYDGTAGIALFLAALQRDSRDPVVAGTAAGAIEHALSRVEDVPDGLQIGLYTGWLGIGYAAILAGRDLCRADIVARGEALVTRAIEAVDIAAAPLDVMSGHAGAIPALLQLGTPQGRATAIACGDALLARAHDSARGLSWDTTGDMRALAETAGLTDDVARWFDEERPHLTGHSHGAAGIGLALFELAHATGERRFADAAARAFAYEDSWFTPQRGWPDLRHTDHSGCAPSAWCHGAAGIGLTRLRAWQLTGAPAYRAAAVEAMRLAAQVVLSALAGVHNYSLCHGVAGDAELFLLAASLLGDGEAAQLAATVALHGLSTYAQSGARWPCGVAGAGESPSLMLGIAGTGYFFLRMAAPQRTRSVLLITP
jgi:lantibiotic biosynthesis protein